MRFWKNIFRKDTPVDRQAREDPTSEEDSLADAIVVTDVLDLHGFYPEQVPEMVHDFLINAQELGLKSLRIIHGKGKSKLKWVVLKELEKHSEVESFHDAPAEMGGWGATMIYLRPESVAGNRD